MIAVQKIIQLVLIYIYYGKNSFENKLCEKTLYSQTIIDYLNANYIVWQCDNHSQPKFHLSHHSGRFIKKILPKIKYGKIVSLELRKLISITVHNLQYVHLSRDYQRCFPNWTRLSLYNYDREINYAKLENILYELQHQLKRFEIHCPGLYVSYNNIDPPKDLKNKLIMIEYLLIDISLPSSNPMYGYRESYATQYFLVETKLMQTMPHIRYLHLIIQNHDIQRVCYFAPWEMILFTFFKLQKIQIDVCGSTSENKESLANRALEIQTEIRTHRKSFQFQIKIL
ncbi:unnamed protein product [Adineta steineri]|uniref:Uncharacterized protein n=1 Tax=Adineta steineri TaxID=433720 RepID=A0A819ZR31_9BILA|nr:unnamed protein product [Adineta steineri]